MKKHTKPTPHKGYLARAVRTFYSDLKNVKHDDPNLKSAIKLGKRCYEDMMKKEKTYETTEDLWSLKGKIPICKNLCELLKDKKRLYRK